MSGDEGRGACQARRLAPAMPDSPAASASYSMAVVVSTKRSRLVRSTPHCRLDQAEMATLADALEMSGQRRACKPTVRAWRRAGQEHAQAMHHEPERTAVAHLARAARRRVMQVEQAGA